MGICTALWIMEHPPLGRHLVQVNPKRKRRAGERERAPGYDVDFADCERAPANDNGGSALALRIFLLLVAVVGIFVIGSSLFWPIDSIWQ